MEMTMCEALAGYGEVLTGDATAKTGVVLLQRPSPQLADKSMLRSVGRWVLKLDSDPSDERTDLYQSLAERAEADQLTSLAVVGHHSPQALRQLSGLDLSERVAKRNSILAGAREATIEAAELISKNTSQHLTAGRELDFVTLFYHDDSGTLQVFNTQTKNWKAVPSAPAC